MNSKEFQFEEAKLDSLEQELKAREAKVNLDLGYKQLQAQLEIDYAKLKFELEKETLTLKKRKLYEQYKKDAVDSPFKEENEEE